MDLLNKPLLLLLLLLLLLYYYQSGWSLTLVLKPANRINECMFTGPPLQPLLWDITVRAWMSTNLLLADIQKVLLQIGVKEENRDAFRFLFNINDKERHLTFAWVLVAAEASPFLLGPTLQYHFDQQESEFEDIATALKENTYVNNLMKTGEELEDLESAHK